MSHAENASEWRLALRDRATVTHMLCVGSSECKRQATFRFALSDSYTNDAVHTFKPQTAGKLVAQSASDRYTYAVYQHLSPQRGEGASLLTGRISIREGGACMKSIQHAS